MNKKILKLIEQRLNKGEQKYGHENVLSDGRDFLKESEPHLDQVSKDRIVTVIMERLKTRKPKDKTWTYTDSGVKSEWIDKHWEEEPSYGFQTGNKYNEGGDCYQMALPLGYEARKLYTSVKNYIEEGKMTEIILHIGKGVKSLDSLNNGRKKLL